MNDPRATCRPPLQAVPPPRRPRPGHPQLYHQPGPHPADPGSTSPNSCWRPALTPSPSRTCPASSPPHAAFELVSEIKKRYDVTLHLHCHATTGMAEMALLKAIEAGVDGVDTAISSMSATYGHPATEALVATLAGTPYDTGLDIHRLEASPRTSARCAKIPRLRRPAERHRQPYPRRPGAGRDAHQP